MHGATTVEEAERIHLLHTRSRDAELDAWKQARGAIPNTGERAEVIICRIRGAA